MYKKIFIIGFSLLIIGVANAAQISKEQWLSAMETALPAAFCKEIQYFRQCFEVSARECEQVAASTTRICLDKYQSKMPAVFNQPQDGSKWGRTIGACAGTAYELTLIKKRINNEKCNNVNNWR